MTKSMIILLQWARSTHMVMSQPTVCIHATIIHCMAHQIVIKVYQFWSHSWLGQCGSRLLGDEFVLAFFRWEPMEPWPLAPDGIHDICDRWSTLLALERPRSLCRCKSRRAIVRVVRRDGYQPPDASWRPSNSCSLPFYQWLLESPLGGAGRVTVIGERSDNKHDADVR